jgi:hypothetical protein
MKEFLKVTFGYLVIWTPCIPIEKHYILQIISAQVLSQIITKSCDEGNEIGCLRITVGVADEHFMDEAEMSCSR